MIWTATLVGLMALTSAAGADKSGVKPQVISLPSGPGSIEGLGESFEAQINTGLVSYALRLESMPGVAGFAPDLVLIYSGGGANGAFGLGWSLSGLAHVQRQTDKGLPAYDATDTFIDAGGAELVSVGNGVYRPKVEGSFVRYERLEGGWLATRKDGVRMRLGMAPEAQVRDGARVFRWLLEEMEDTNGNRIRFVHAQLDPATPQRYCKEIVYAERGGNLRRIVFEYEVRQDVIADYRPTFRLEDKFRCTAIAMYTNTALIRRYDLAYVKDCNLSLLASVTQVGNDGVSTLPPAEFTYTQFDPSQAAVRAVLPSAQGDEYPFYPLANEPEATLADMNANGLPDLLLARQGRHEVYLNGGVGPDGQHRWGGHLDMGAQSPSEGLGVPGATLADIDGDGRVDFVARLTGNSFAWWPNEGTGVWGAPKSLNDSGNLPPEDFESAEVQLVDINFDKRTDVMYAFASDGGEYAYFLNRGGAEFQPPLYRTGLGGARTFGQVAGLKMGDMNGDRLQDLVYISDGIVVYWPATGVGEWDMTRRGAWAPGQTDTGTRMANAPDSSLHDEPGLRWDAESLLIMDVNGDGLSDLVYAQAQQDYVVYWLNCNSMRFEGPYRVRNLPVFGADGRVLPADMNGNGSTDLVWNNPEGANGNSQAYWQYLDFTPGDKPYLLKTASNGIGKTITFEYTTSTEQYVRDAHAGAPWAEGVPSPVNILAATVTTDGMGGYYRTEYRYREGYFDGEEKEFRGFASVDVLEIGEVAYLNGLGANYTTDQDTPTLVSRHEFDVGKTEEALKGRPLRVVSGSGSVANGLVSVIGQEEITWEVRTLATGAGGDSRDVRVAYQTFKAQDILEEGRGVPVRLETEFDHDDYGNLILQAEYGRVENGDRGAWEDERITVSSYTGTDTSSHDLGLSAFDSGDAVSRWMLNRLVEREVRDMAGNVLTRRQDFYDGAALGQVDGRGNLTETREWHTPASANGFVRSQRRDYDDRGNPIALYGPLYGQQPGHLREIAYDAAFATFPTREVIHTGNSHAPTLIIEVEYEPGLGVVTRSLDFNGHETRYQHDAFGRLAAVVKPYDSDGSPTITYRYTLGATVPGVGIMNWIDTEQREEAGGGTLDAREFRDGLGRVFMKRAESDTPGQAVVSDASRYNARQTEYMRYLPYFDPGGLQYAPTPPNTSGMRLQRDARQRGTRTTYADGAFTESIHLPLGMLLHDEEQTNPASPHHGCGYRYTYDGIKGEEDKERLRRVDEIVRIKDDGTPGPLTEWSTHFTYDALNNLTSTTDSQGNTRSLRYDGLRRRYFADDPDAGWRFYNFDDNGNVTRRTDASGQVLAFTYDGVNRIQAEYYLAAGEPADRNLVWGRALAELPLPNRAPDVEYHYDQDGTGPDTEFRLTEEKILQAVLAGQQNPALDQNQDGQLNVADLVRARHLGPSKPQGAPLFQRQNTRGVLAWVRDDAGQEHFSYDARGRVAGRLRGIEDAESPLQRNFHERFSYDAADRVTMREIPGELRLDYTYGPQGLLHSIPGAVVACTYNAAGAPVEERLACGVTERYIYDHRYRRITHRSVLESEQLDLQHRAYRYDRASNPVEIQDLRSIPSQPTTPAQRNLKEFYLSQGKCAEYDSLYRIVRAELPTVASPLAWRYDRIGNMLEATGDEQNGFASAIYGGAQGSSGRFGRAPGDAPGPHARTVQTPLDRTKENDSWAYDDRGNATNTARHTYLWDSKLRVAAIEDAEKQASLKNLYASDDTRVRAFTEERRTSRATYYASDIFEYRANRLVAYAMLANRRVARVVSLPADESSEVQEFMLHNHLGSTSMHLDQQGMVAASYTYAPFGNLIETKEQENRRSKDYLYTGKELHLDDLAHFGARFYNPSAGIFLSPDPLAFTGGDSNDIVEFMKRPQLGNVYGYAEGRPYAQIDPDGKEPITITIAVTMFVISAGADIAMQVAMNRVLDKPKEIDFKQVAISGFLGMVTGGAGAAASVGSKGAILIGKETAKQFLVGQAVSAIPLGVATAADLAGADTKSKRAVTSVAQFATAWGKAGYSATTLKDSSNFKNNMMLAETAHDFYNVWKDATYDGPDGRPRELPTQPLSSQQVFAHPGTN